MCNSYRIIPTRGVDAGVRDLIAAAAGTLVGSLVRKSDLGVVLLADERVEIMRWGFWRSFNPAVNNARSDKLAGGMWKDARRCVIPMTAFYEWGAGGGRGRKQAYEFLDPRRDFLWVAGVWESNPELGPCYSMITTEAPPLMAPIHDRMPAVLRADEMAAFLAQAERWDFEPFGGDLIVNPCASPLVKPRPPDSQGQLFG